MDGGGAIRAARERHGVSQRGLAVRAGTSQGYISQVERGEVSPSVEAVSRLLACLGETGRIETAPLAPADTPTGPAAEGLRPGPMLAALVGRDVELVLVGALAAQVHGVELPAGAVEVTLDPDPRNQERLTRALGDLRGRIATVRPARDGSRALASGATFSLTTSEGPLVLAPTGIRHLVLARRAGITKVGGVAVPCAGSDDLIARSRPGGVSEDPALFTALTVGETETPRT
ncbi:MAG: helix-turn-helix domain-containing protein [Actinomycetota bacterium]|nr:helix-turn-helix domain-containing protein [Actinomycetota bacterium]